MYEIARVNGSLILFMYKKQKVSGTAKNLQDNVLSESPLFK